MTIEELFRNLGIAADKQEEAKRNLNAFLDGAYVPKSRFNEVNEEKKTLQAPVTDRDKQLETLKNSKGDVDALKDQIKALQDANKKAQDEAEAKLQEVRLNDAIKLAIVDKAQDVDIVSNLFDKSKLILGEDGKVTGLDDQLKALQETKSFLFKPVGGKPKYAPNGGGNAPTVNPFAKETFNLTEQGKLLRDNPEQAKALAAAAGVTL